MKTDPNILLGRIIQKMVDQGYCQVDGYNKFTYLRHNNKEIVVGREKGEDTTIYYHKMVIGIKGYQLTSSDYECGPTKLREYGLTHVTSPIFSMLHLLSMNDYQ